MKFAIGLGKKTALQAAMESRKAPLDAQRLGITAGVGLCLVLAVISLFDGVQRGREASTAGALDEARASLVAAIGTEVRARAQAIAAAAQDTELTMAVTGFDSAAQMRAKQRLRALVPDLVDAEFHDAGLPDLIEADLAKFGYAKADLLAEARETGQGARVQIHACGEQAQCLAFGQPIRNGEVIVGYLYALLPLDALTRPIEAAAVEGGVVELRQGKSANAVGAVISVDRSTGGASEVDDLVEPVPGSLLSVATRVPTLFRMGAVFGVFNERGATSLFLQGLIALAGVVGLIVFRQRLPKLDAAVDEGDVQAPKPKATMEQLQEKLAANAAADEAAAGAQQAAAEAAKAEQLAKPAPAGALDRSMFRAYDIRGIVDQNLTAGTAQLIGQSIGSIVRERGMSEVCVARDGRLSGPDLSQALIRGLRMAGCDVIDIGAAPTPVLYFATHQLNNGNGVMVTGSHNPPDYNGFKIVVGGQTLAEEAIQDIFARIVEGRLAHGNGGVSSVDVKAEYIERITGDVQAMRRMKVVVDAGNGIAGAFAPQVLEGIGCEVMPLYCEVDGHFPNHHPDPSDLHNLDDLKIAIKQYNADIGLAFDGDGDRLGVVTKSGEVIFPDRLLMLFAEDVLTRNPGAAVIYDVKCTGQLSEHILRNGGSPVMWKTGHSLIKAKMREEDSALAGEMSGHFFFGERWYGFDDGIYAAARLMEILAQRDESPEAVFATLPKGVSTPELKIPMVEGEHYAFVERFRERAKFPGAKVTTIDGVRADYKDGFGLVRCSNTTPCLVLRFDALNKIGLDRIQDSFRSQLLAVDPSLNLPF
ncbi:MAG TPA: phosphomannomutase/phosphoglucomutase [Patescibacteria group bacterium]|nr:phosphomannomutase/phosphoglucomutase [Patescibacteria group bacterium]